MLAFAARRHLMLWPAARRSWAALAGWIGAVLLTGAIGGLANGGRGLAGVAAAGIESGRRGAPLFVVQLRLIALWSWLFFAWHRIDLAVVEILILWLGLAATLAAFARVRPAAGALLLPYLLWVSFAGALTLEVWRRNGG